MSKFISFLTLISLLGCCKTHELAFEDQLVGQWQWVESTGGIDGRTDTPNNTGKEIILEFSTTTLRTFLNGSLDTEISYEVQLGSTIYSTDPTELIIYENGSKQSVQLKAAELILLDECYDCFQHRYTRK